MSNSLIICMLKCLGVKHTDGFSLLLNTLQNIMDWIMARGMDRYMIKQIGQNAHIATTWIHYILKKTLLCV